MKNFNRGLLVAVAALVAPALALATPPDPFAGIVDAIDFTAVGTVVAAAGAALAIVLVLRKGVRLALGMIK